MPPSRWYLTGFLVPKSVRDGEKTEEETAGAEPKPTQKNRLPASLGMSVLLPGGGEADVVTASLTFAESVLEEREHPDEKKKQRIWRRVPRGPVEVEVPLHSKKVATGLRLPEFPGVVLKGKLAAAEARGCPKARARCRCSW